MKIKIFPVILSLIIVVLTVVSCVSLPLENQSAESDTEYSFAESSVKEQSEENSVISVNSEEASVSPVSSEEATSKEASKAEISEEPSKEEPSAEPSKEEPSEEVSEEQSEEPSEEPSEETSTDPNLPYPTYDGINSGNIGTSSYDAYFKNSMFIGNSILVHFNNYLDAKIGKYPGFMGETIVFARSNFSALHDAQKLTPKEDEKNDSNHSWHPSLNGVKMTCADAVAASKVDTVYLALMALNELGLHSDKSTCAKETFNSTITLIESIKAKSPDVKIVIVSNTYMAYNHNNYAKLNNGNISILNNLMLNYCNENGMDFIDVSTFLMDGNVLAAKYCSDDEDGGSGCHLTNNAYALWTAAFRNYAYQKQSGTYKNPTSMKEYTKNVK